tara:strand:+ start:191 stop:811 length:621 start_codon:yes stop_codon:yes gene_type:complete
MNGSNIFNCIQSIEEKIINHKDEIEKLDQEIGDGDHIFNILRGLKEINFLKKELILETPDTIFKKLGMKIMTTVGGSSGALIATLLIGMSKNYNNNSKNLENIANMFFAGVEAMKQRGKSDIGEKTMLDVLIPVANKLKEIKNEQNMNLIAQEIKKVAETGMLSTKDLVATKGRASFLGERAKGHIDPGARSSQLAIEAICNNYIK